jgi:hypothetical protein
MELGRNCVDVTHQKLWWSCYYRQMELQWNFPYCWWNFCITAPLADIGSCLADGTLEVLSLYLRKQLFPAIGRAGSVGSVDPHGEYVQMQTLIYGWCIQYHGIGILYYYAYPWKWCSWCSPRYLATVDRYKYYLCGCCVDPGVGCCSWNVPYPGYIFL